MVVGQAVAAEWAVVGSRPFPSGTQSSLPPTPVPSLERARGVLITPGLSGHRFLSSHEGSSSSCTGHLESRPGLLCLSTPKGAWVFLTNIQRAFCG